jgi:hypothetical protein
MPSRPQRQCAQFHNATNNALVKWLQMIQSGHLKLLTAILHAPGCALAGLPLSIRTRVMANISKATEFMEAAVKDSQA